MSVPDLEPREVMKPHYSHEYDYIYEENHPSAGGKASSLCGELRHGNTWETEKLFQNKLLAECSTGAMSKDKYKCLTVVN